MFNLVSLALLALAAFSAVNSAPIAARKAPPADWNTDCLEPYDAYNARYLAIGCQDQHNTQFFDDCCHPMKKGETLGNNRMPYCRPGASLVPSSTPVTESPPPNLAVQPSPTSSPAPEPTDDDCEGDDDETGDDNDDDEDCDDDDEPVSSPAPVPASSDVAGPASTSVPPEPTSTPNYAPPASTPNNDQPTSTPSSPDPSSTPAGNTPSGETHTGGHATWFTQNGNAGACGDTHSDSDFIAALDYRTYGDSGAKSQYCGQMIRVTWQGKSVDVKVADDCPSCQNAASVDLSVAAFQSLASQDVGELDDISWVLL